MQLLALERELVPIDPERQSELLKEEAARVWELEKSGVIRAIWFTRPHRRAVALLECASEEEAKQHLASLPLVQAHLIAFDVMPLGAYDGLDRLLADAHGRANGRSGG